MNLKTKPRALQQRLTFISKLNIRVKESQMTVSANIQTLFSPTDLLKVGTYVIIKAFLNLFLHTEFDIRKGALGPTHSMI